MENKQHNTLLALTTAAMGLVNTTPVHATNTMDQEYIVNYQFSQYGESDLDTEKLASGSTSRYDISVHQFLLRAPISSDTQLTMNFTSESMSGASPWYVVPSTPTEPDEEIKPIQVMSGATIDELRNDVNLKFKTYTKNSNWAVNIGYSKENDYRSTNIGINSAYNFNKKSSTIEWGLGASEDYIDPTNGGTLFRPIKEEKNSINGMLGFSQIINKNTLINTSFTYAFYDGYLADPYKLALVEGLIQADSRPSSKSQVSWSLASRQFIGLFNAAIHADYRYYYNNWGLSSHTLELGWYQNFLGSWQITPKIRYYDQSEALFYEHYYLNARSDGFHSSDYRLSSYSAFSGKIKLSNTFEYKNIVLPVYFSYEIYQSIGDNPGLVDFSVFSLGTEYRF